MEPKILIWIGAELLGVKIFDWLFSSFVDNTKGTITFIIISIYLMARVFFIIRFGLLKLRREEWEQKQREKVK